MQFNLETDLVHINGAYDSDIIFIVMKVSNQSNKSTIEAVKVGVWPPVLGDTKYVLN